MSVTAWLQLIRLPNSFTAASNILAAHAVATAGQPDWGTLLLTLGASLCLYHGGMVLNDCFDYAEDLRERPNRPLPAGRIGRGQAWMMGWTLLAVGILTAGFVNQVALTIAVFLAGSIVLYDSKLLAGLPAAFLMGLCRYLNWLLGMSVVALGPAQLVIALPVLLYVLGLTRLSQIETTAARRTLLYQCEAAVLLAIATIIALVAAGILPEGSVLLFAGVALVPLVRLAWRLQRDFTPPRIQSTIGVLVTGIIPLDAALALGAGQYLAAGVVLALLVPGRWLARHLYVS